MRGVSPGTHLSLLLVHKIDMMLKFIVLSRRTNLSSFP